MTTIELPAYIDPAYRPTSIDRSGYSTPFRTANYRAVHVRGNASNTTLCGKTLSEPNSSFPQGYLHNYKSCSACVRQLEASR